VFCIRMNIRPDKLEDKWTDEVGKVFASALGWVRHILSQNVKLIKFDVENILMIMKGILNGNTML